ncbi:hypothetical protein A3E96_04430 [Candidatus Uhrbacteria bacterium RIFCSPHIGHO2_12_FULL_46_13]|nr:MAG: hypothetical protein A3E96_04430 [Candidatus Uhrbacteria bacterium RIFCSPHIGHO2_12_FULL_46_13]
MCLPKTRSVEIPSQGLAVDCHGDERFGAGKHESLRRGLHHFPLGTHGIPLQAVGELNPENGSDFEALNQKVETAPGNDRHLPFELARAAVVELPLVLPAKIVHLVRTLGRVGQQLNEHAMIQNFHLRHEPPQVDAVQGIGDPGRAPNLLDEGARTIFILGCRRQLHIAFEGVVKTSELVNAGDRRRYQVKIAIRIAHLGLEAARRDVAAVAVEQDSDDVLYRDPLLAAQVAVDDFSTAAIVEEGFDTTEGRVAVLVIREKRVAVRFLQGADPLFATKQRHRKGSVCQRDVGVLKKSHLILLATLVAQLCREPYPSSLGPFLSPDSQYKIREKTPHDGMVIEKCQWKN